MRRFPYLVILILFMFFLVSCSIDNIEISDNIVAPNNEILPISGEWIIDGYKLGNINVMDEETAKKYIGKEVLFHESIVAIGDDYCFDPTFKIKNVNAEDYLLYQYKTNAKILNIDKDEIQVVSVMSKEQFFYEFIKKTDETTIVNIDGTFFYLSKVSDEVDDEKIAEYYNPEKSMFRSTSSKDEDILRTGILIGLKSLNLENKEDNMEEWNYRTVLIRSYNKEIVSTYETDDIFLPRKTGFWKIGVDREKIEGKFNDEIVAYPQKKTIDLKNKEKTEEDILDKENTLMNILYAGNDYISMENIQYLNNGKRLLELYPIDNIDKGTPMKISDIIGEDGKEILLEGANKDFLEDIKYKNSLLNLNPKEESFGLFRRNGHWTFKGRVNFLENGIYNYKDFNIKGIPPKEVVHYDELSVPWNAVKVRTPEAVDAFTSPNEDIIAVITHSYILIYIIDGGEISGAPIAKIELKPVEKVIMAEWAVGRYSLMWEEEFLKNEVKEVEY